MDFNIYDLKYAVLTEPIVPNLLIPDIETSFNLVKSTVIYSNIDVMKFSLAYHQAEKRANTAINHKLHHTRMKCILIQKGDELPSKKYVTLPFAESTPNISERLKSSALLIGILYLLGSSLLILTKLCCCSFCKTFHHQGYTSTEY